MLSALELSRTPLFVIGQRQTQRGHAESIKIRQAST
jgi:hypothetical protein